MNHPRQNFIALLLPVAVLCALAPRSGAAQVLPVKVPLAVIAEAERFTRIAGGDITGPPTKVTVHEDVRTGHTLWELAWYPQKYLSIGVVITVDEQAVRAVEYANSLAQKEDKAAHEAGIKPAITKEIVRAKLQNLLDALPLLSEEWRLIDTWLEPYGGSDNESTWTISKSRYVDGKPVDRGYLHAQISAYSGIVRAWAIEDDAVLIPPSERILSAETGEVLNSGPMTAYVPPPLRRLQRSPRLLLLGEALKARSADALTLALAAGKPEEGARPGRDTRQFTRPINGKPVRFALNASARRLTWETASGQWAGVSLAEKRAQALAAWLDKQQNIAEK